MTPSRIVDPAVMQRIHDEVKTPFKYGVVLPAEPGEMLDCPNVFRHGGRWYMMFVSIKDKVGYQTHLARSDDLRHWERLGPILSFRQAGWDAWQADGGLALYDTRWGGTHELGQHDGKYWLSYIGGAGQGYEPDPLAIGLAWTKAPAAPVEWTRLPENPVLSNAQPDVRPFESVTLYKSAIIRDEAQSLGWPFVMFYNGKTKQGSHEAIGMAVSRDLVNWTRYGAEPVVDNAPGKPAITGDPQITKIGDVWVMFYFGFRWLKGTTAFDTFACSYDLVNWTKWDGEPLVKPSEPFDKTFAHKPWVLKHDGIVYHFYCAVGTGGRVIALATSQDLKATDEKQMPALHIMRPSHLVMRKSQPDTPRRCAPPLSRGDLRWRRFGSPLGEGCPPGRGVSGSPRPHSTMLPVGSLSTRERLFESIRVYPFSPSP